MRAGRVRTLAALLVLPALALRCGAAAPTVSHTLSDRASALLVQAPQVYAPASLPGASGQMAAIQAAFEGSLEPQARARLRHDPALDLVAAAAAETFSDQTERTSPSLLQWLFWKSGSLALLHSHVGGYAWGKGSRAMLDAWASKAGEGLNAAPGRMLSYGLASLKDGAVRSEMIVFGHSAFDVPTFPKTYAPGAPLALALQPRTPLREIRFLLDRADAIDEQILAPQPDGSFVVSRQVPVRPGRYFVEIQGPSPRRPMLVLFPIYVGVPEPAAPDDFIQHPPAGPGDPTAWPAWLASRYDDERQRIGKPPLEIDTRLSLLAAERSALFAAERSAPAIDAPMFAQRLALLGLQPRELAESVVRGFDTDAVLLHMLRPSVRGRMVFADRVRLGAAATPRPPKQNMPPRFVLVEEAVVPGGEP